MPPRSDGTVFVCHKLCVFGCNADNITIHETTPRNNIQNIKRLQSSYSTCLHYPNNKSPQVRRHLGDWILHPSLTIRTRLR